MGDNTIFCREGYLGNKPDCITGDGGTSTISTGGGTGC